MCSLKYQSAMLEELEDFDEIIRHVLDHLLTYKKNDERIYNKYV
jgi:predicted SprT family Zn-dependent metalloprotease